MDSNTEKKQYLATRTKVTSALEAIYTELPEEETNDKTDQKVDVKLNVQPGKNSSSVMLGCTTTLDYGCKLTYKKIDITRAAQITDEKVEGEPQHVELVLTIPVMSRHIQKVVLTTKCNADISSEVTPETETKKKITDTYEIQQDEYKQVDFMVNYNDVNYHICIEIAPFKPDQGIEHYIQRETAYTKGEAINKQLKNICSVFEKTLHTSYNENFNQNPFFNWVWLRGAKEDQDINQLTHELTSCTRSFQSHFQQIYNCCNLTERNNLLTAMVPSVAEHICHSPWTCIDHRVSCHPLDSSASKELQEGKKDQIQCCLDLLNRVINLQNMQLTTAFVNELGGKEEKHQKVREIITRLTLKRQDDMGELTIGRIADIRFPEFATDKQVKARRSVLYLHMNCIDYCLVRAVNFLCGISSDKMPSIHQHQIQELLTTSDLDVPEYEKYKNCQEMVDSIPTHNNPPDAAECLANYIIKHKYLQYLGGVKMKIALSQNQYYAKPFHECLELDPATFATHIHVGGDDLRFFKTVLYGELFIKKITPQQYHHINTQEHTWLEDLQPSDSKLQTFLQKIDTYTK